MSTSRAAIRSGLSLRLFVPLAFLRRGYGVPLIVPERRVTKLPVQPDAAEHDEVESDSFEYEAHICSPGCLLVRGGDSYNPLAPPNLSGYRGGYHTHLLPRRFLMKSIDPKFVGVFGADAVLELIAMLVNKGVLKKEDAYAVIKKVADKHAALDKETATDANKETADFAQDMAEAFLSLKN